MENNTKNCDFVKNKFEECLMNLDFKFKFLELEDDDINYDISFNAPKPFKFIETLNGIMYANLEDNIISFIALNIYTISSKEIITPYYKLVNDVNNLIIHGKFSIRKDIRQIIYRASIDCGEDFENLTKKKIQLLVDDYAKNLLTLFIAILANDSKK